MSERPSRRARDDDRADKPLLRRASFWVPLTLGVLLLAIIGIGIAGWQIAERGLAAQDELSRAIPLAQQAQDQILAGDQAGAAATIDELAVHSAEARELTDAPIWRAFEWVPTAGENLTAVRVASASVDELVDGVMRPATGLTLDSLKPVDGAIDVAALAELATVLDDAAVTVERVAADLADLDRDQLIGPVADGIARLDDAVEQVTPIIEPARAALNVLPGALGADGPRNYLVLFQNNAESRGTGGNPAALLLVNVTDGRISIAQQASSSSFDPPRTEPIIELDPESEALYGDKIGRYVMDVTTTPDFTESAELIRAWWADEFGTQVDGVVSFDPVALGYLLGATGPVTLSTGDTLTADNAVPLLLNEAYYRFEPEEQDAFFAAAAASVFQVLTSGAGETDALIDAVTRAIDEGRLMYAPSDAGEAEYIAGTRITGTLPADNSEQTMLGIYVNDITEGKLDYWMQLDATGTTDACTVDTATAPTFTTTATLTSTLPPDQAANLPERIATGRFFAKGHVSTDVVLYGPVGATLASVTVDGAPADVSALPHLGRPAVKVNVLNPPGAVRTITAVWTGEAAAVYGPLEVRHTPMVRPANVTIDAPGCEAQANAAE